MDTTARTKYMEECVVLDSSEILPLFGLIINVLLIKPNEPYFVCELLETAGFSSTFIDMLYRKPSLFPLHSASQKNYQIIIL